MRSWCMCSSTAGNNRANEHRVLDVHMGHMDLAVYEDDLARIGRVVAVVREPNSRCVATVLCHHLPNHLLRPLSSKP